MKAMVLAAGRGARLSPLTDVCPKPLMEVGGQTLLERILCGLEAAGFTRIVVNVSWLGEQIIEVLRQRTSVAEIVISDERDERLETGGGICKALPHLGSGAFAVVNADVLSDYSWPRLAARIAQWSSDELAHLVLVPNPPHNPGGDFGFHQGRLLSEPAYTFAGISVLSAGLFAGQRPGEVFALAPLLRDAVRQQRASAELHTGYWNDVGTRDRLEAARAWAGGAASPG